MRASIVNDATGARLVLQSSTTGVANGFRVQVSGDDGNDDNASGLSRLSYDPPTGRPWPRAARRRKRLGHHQRADGGSRPPTPWRRDGRRHPDTRTRPTTSPVTVSVREHGVDAQAIPSFVKGGTTTWSTCCAQNKSTPTSRPAARCRATRPRCRILGSAAFSAESSASSVFARASDLGLTLQKDGTIKHQQQQARHGFAQAVAGCRFFFARQRNGGVWPRPGAAVRHAADRMDLLGVDGAVTSREDGLRKLKTLNSDRQAAAGGPGQCHRGATAQTVPGAGRQHGTATSLSNYVSQQITNWNKA